MELCKLPQHKFQGTCMDLGTSPDLVRTLSRVVCTGVGHWILIDKQLPTLPEKPSVFSIEVLTNKLSH